MWRGKDELLSSDEDVISASEDTDVGCASKSE